VSSRVYPYYSEICY